jgi:hypothetical protein
MLNKFDFFQPEEVVVVECEFVKAFLCEAFTGCEVGWMCQKWWECEERVFGNVVDGVEFFWECCRDQSNFLVDSLVLEHEGARIGG